MPNQAAQTPASIDRVRGEPWEIGTFSHSSPSRVPIDMTGSRIASYIETADGRIIAIDRELGLEEDGTGYAWVDQAAGKYLIRVAGEVTATLPYAKLVLRVIDASGRPKTKGTISINVYTK